MPYEARDYIDAALANGEGTVITLYDSASSKVIGAACFHEHEEEVHLVNLGSLRRGVGTRLMHHVLAIAGDKPIRLLSENSAVGFYKKFGFRVTERCAEVSEMRRD